MSLLTSLIPSISREASSNRDGNAAGRDVGPSVRPVFDIKEAIDAFGVTVFLPGVNKEGLDISAEEGVITIVGRRGWKRPETWMSLYRESSDAAYQLTLRHDASVDVDKIHAELRDGVLRVSLPKTEALKPRKITVS